VARAPKPIARAPRPVPAEAPASAPATSGDATAPSAGADTGVTGGGGAGSGGGDGSGGDGSGGARVAYGQNPPPPYPLVARRLGMEGVVLLDVLVAPDGRAAEVRLARSSGHPQLDDSAVRTVRERWRFIPARRAGAAVESRVTVPIRFRLSGVETTG
jgi:protein TonB